MIGPSGEHGSRARVGFFFRCIDMIESIGTIIIALLQHSLFLYICKVT